MTDHAGLPGGVADAEGLGPQAVREPNARKCKSSAGAVGMTRRMTAVLVA